MTTLIPFRPAPASPFEFQPTLDDQVYTATVVWSLFGRRWFMNLATLDQTLVAFLPVIASPSGVDIQSLKWDNGFITAVTRQPHQRRVLDTIAITLSGCAPDIYNGKINALVTKPNTFAWPMNANPGDATRLGVIDFNINIVGGYFKSTLVYRETTQNFEITP